MSDECQGWRVGDRVEVGSVWVREERSQPGRPRWRPGIVATGYIEEFIPWGQDMAQMSARVRFDCGPVNGVDWCTASLEELTRIEEVEH